MFLFATVGGRGPKATAGRAHLAGMNIGTHTHLGKDKQPSAAIAAVSRAGAASRGRSTPAAAASSLPIVAPARTGRPLLAALVLAITLTLVAAYAFAGPARAGVRDFRAGVVNGPPVGAPDLTRMREAGVRTLRVIFSWDTIETERRTGSSCSTAVYSGFARYDQMVAEAGRRGIKILPFFLGAPGYVPGGDYSNMPPTGTRAMGDYICWVRALVRRYGRGGTFVTANGPAQPITEWQLWNEVNLANYAAKNRVNPNEYGRFVKQSTAAIRGVDGQATIVLAGLPERVKNGVDAEPYLKRFYRVKQIERKFDVVALHPYAVNARGVKGALTRMRDLLRRVGDRRQVIWLTEVGYASRGPKGHFLVNSEQGQAEKLASTLKLVRKNRKRYQVGTVHWYNWRDTAPYDAGGEWFQYAGLYREDGSPKPSCNAYARFTGGRRPCSSIPTSQQSQSLQEPALEAQSQQGVLPSPPPAE